ncbi:MAG: c-type cytochrome [Burkholderiaceae bacterium]
MALVAAILLAAAQAAAQGRQFTLSAPASLTDNGLLAYLVPRFSLKTATRVRVVADDAPADAALNRASAGRPVFSGPDGDWSLAITDGPNAAAVGRFEAWLTSEIGRNTVLAFAVNGRHPYRPADVAKADATTARIVGDADQGEVLAERHCGRCHMVNERTRMTTIGSTPSFALLRGFPDWLARFQSFFVRRPHPAFTQVRDVTEPFHESRPPPISPLRMTIDDVQAIAAYVETIEPADLGQPLKLQ